MRRAEDTPLDPEILAMLEAIDATLAGEPVEPRHAETAELALLLADERPRPRPAFAATLDTRVATGFAAPGGRPSPPRRSGGWWATRSAAGLLAACCAVAIVIVAGGGRGTTSASFDRAAPTHSASSSASEGKSSASGAGSSAGATAGGSSGSAAVPGLTAQSAAGAGAGASAGAPAPPGNGRRIVQSATLALSTGPRQIDGVAQEVFDVVGAAGGIVDRSSVTQTGGLDGIASFELRVPSAELETTLGRLSNLRGATVVSRTDNSEDVNSSYVSAQRALADARALRAALLGQLARAQTTAAIDSLHARIARAEATIAADEAALRALNARIDFSPVSVTISAAQPVSPPPVHHSSGGFGIGRAAHVAGRVLVVAAGVALIALAVLLPIALLAGGIAGATATLRRHRREQALDLV